ncbi:MAG TPA: efflux RND transporter permease subunit [Candidatus Hydrogenedentes bacterium]|nr:efflux RND transporter permease subunit [Candidatus Hydrogenedentota bacterium]
MTHPEETPEKNYRIAIRRPVTMVMIFLTIAVFGLRSYQQLPINLMPNISYPSLTVRTEYEGAAPEDVEKLVTRPLEEMLSIVGGLVEISSVSKAGLSEILLEFSWGTNMTIAQQDVRDRLDVFEPPREVSKKPVILRYDPSRDPVMRLAIVPDQTFESPEKEAEALTAIRDAAERHVKADLEAENGIAQASVKGGQKEEIQVLVDADKIKGLGVSLDTVVTSLAQQNINLSGGQLREGKAEYLVRTRNEFESIEEIAASLVPTPGGQYRLSDLAEVFMGTKDRETIVHVNGREAVAIEIYKEGDANTVSVCNRVKDLFEVPRKLSAAEQFVAIVREQMKRVQQEASKALSAGPTAAGALTQTMRTKRNLTSRLPGEVRLSLMSDQSRFIVASIEEVQSATWMGGLLALAILFLFLRELKSTVIIGVAIPISVVATFVPMFVQSVSLNIMSLGGLALGVGMLVDNSIVVLESIFRCREEGDGVLDAAERGTREVAGAVLSSTLTTVCVFLPITFVEGIAGQLFRDLALTVTYALLASLLTSLYLVPLLASRGRVRLEATRQVVWTARAWREARDQRGWSVAASVIAVIPLGLLDAGRGMARIWGDTVGGAWRGMRGPLHAAGDWRGWGAFLASLGGALLGLVSLPLMIALFALQSALALVYALLSTLLHLLALAALVLMTVARAVLAVVLWPLLFTWEKAFALMLAVYRASITRALRFSAVFLLLVLGLGIHAATVAGRLGRELIPPMKQGEFGVRVESRAGTRLEDMEARARLFEEVLRTAPEVETVTVEIGREKSSTESNRGENIAVFNVLLKNPDETAAFQDQIVERLRAQVMDIRTDEQITFTVPSLFSFNTAVEVQLVGDDLDELRRVGAAAVEAVSRVKGVKDTELSIKPGYPEVIIELDRELLAARGLSPGQVAQRLRTEVQGDVATRFSRMGEKVDIRVRTDRAMLSNVDDLRRLSVTDGLVRIPLADVANITVREGPSEVRRVDQRQVALIYANVEGRDLGAAARDIDDALRTVDRPEDFYFIQGGQNRELNTAYDSLRFALILALFLVYVVMACQFESIVHPALVMFSIPLAFIGVIHALDRTGTSLSVMVFLGGIVLAGIVVNNAIVLVDYINQLRGRGMSKREAIVHAGTVRMRPILMTTLTTVLGLLPMLTATGEGAEIRRPMAITVMAGLVSSTLLTLFIIPMVYDLFGGKDRK